MQPIELLSPARDAACAIEAIRHGADAVYMGAEAFGARAAAGNTVGDIAAVCRYAHLFGARVYVTLNTILYDDELSAAERLAHALYEAGVDALIVQDMAWLRLDLPPIALHASTQMDNRTPADAQRLEAAGFSQIVLARELSLDDIRRVHAATSLPLEAFVHGALCVSYSGRCYASQYCFGRSANRGRCAQFCRLKFDLLDAQGRTLVAGRHLLSLRDMNRAASLEEMMDAGVRSFKIEGRLKDVTYVKNITAYYRRAIDAILARRGDSYVRASRGETTLTFTPQPAKSFNRGFTSYFLHGRAAGIEAFASPKSVGEAIGRVAQVGRRSFTLEAGAAQLEAGDGLCFLTPEGALEGFRVNRVAGREVFPATMPPLRAGTTLSRNTDSAFEHLLARPSAQRRLWLDITLRETSEGYALVLCAEGGATLQYPFTEEKQTARAPQREAQARALGKLGDTPFSLRTLTIETEGERFIPASRLTQVRRDALNALTAEILKSHPRDPRRAEKPSAWSTATDYTANVANRVAAGVYRDHGCPAPAPAYELAPPTGAVLMYCRHCLRYSLGFCPKHHPAAQRPPEPLALRLSDGRTFPLGFDCRNCQMLVYAPTP